MRAAVLTAGDPLDIRTWSGTPYFMTKALQGAFPDLLAVRSPRPPWFQYLRRVTRKATFGRIDIAWSYALARHSAYLLAEQLRAERIDVALAIGNAPLSAFLADQLPTIHISDATAPLMREYYAEFIRLPKALAKTAYQLDRLSVLRSRACLFSTEWAAQSAIRDYGANPSHIHAIPWGANIDAEPTSSQEARELSNVCHLVFIGVDWERKGGALAVDTAKHFAAAGRPVKLHIIGANPELRQPSESIIVHGFINKGSAEGRVQFDRIMKQASFLFVPTRQDCSPMVFAEANSYGVPVITTSTGGVADVVHEGVNGHLLPIDAKADAYADLIWAVWADQSRYNRLRNSSRRRFTDVLNWKSWLSAAIPIINEAAGARPPAASEHPPYRPLYGTN